MTTESRSRSRNTTPADACACSPGTLLALEDPARRAVVSILVERDAPVPVGELPARIAACDGRSAGDRDDAALSLRHTHLPKLRNAGLVRDAPGDAVALGSHPDLRDGRLTASLLAGVGGDVWTALGALHRDPVRPAVLAQLDAAGSAFAVDELAGRLARSRAAGDDADAIELALRRVHLPRLEAVGLVAHDPDADEVTYDGTAWIRLPALVAALGDDRR